jgi:predicted alpha/beta superfamily hydrolase
MHLDRYPLFESQYVPARDVEVWLPPGYDASGNTRYPVIYMHDGQNLFEPEKSFIGVDWGIDEALTGLLGRGEVPPVIVVGIANTDNRLGEYMPEKALPDEKSRAGMTKFIQLHIPGAPYQLNGDAYLKFLIQELKPFIDQTYPTCPDAPHTFLMGSSMGGLISLYALGQYPDVFGGAACLSTAWHIGRKLLMPYYQDAFPCPEGHKVYLDMGGQELHHWFPVVQWVLNRLLLKLHNQSVQYALDAGFRDGENLLAMTFPQAEHSERAWRKRVHIPLRFLLIESPD